MSSTEITIVRIYLHEGQKQLQNLLSYLHDESKVRGVTVFRGISGFGRSGKYHSSTLIDMSLDLPVIIEFFDAPERIEDMLQHLNTLVDAGHMVYWPAKMNEQ